MSAEFHLIHNELVGHVELSEDKLFLLEAITITTNEIAKHLGVSLSELLTDIWKTHHVQNRV